MSNIKWTIETLKTEALKYTNRVEFRKGNQSAYNSANYRNILDSICSHMPKHLPRKWNISKLTVEGLYYSNKKDMLMNSKIAYNIIRDKYSFYDICPHFTDLDSDLSKIVPIPSMMTGLYILYKGEKIIYVGKSNRCIMDRIRKHILITGTEYKTIDNITAYRIDNSADLDVAEIYLINKYKPQFNTESNSIDNLTIEINNLDKIITKEYNLTIKDNICTIHSS